MPSQITHKYLLHIKQLHVLCYCTLISDGCHQVIVLSVVSKNHKCNICTRTQLGQPQEINNAIKLTEHYVREQILQVSAGNYKFGDKYSDLNEVSYNHWKLKEFESYSA